MKNSIRLKFLASALLGVAGFLCSPVLSHAQNFRVNINTAALNLPANGANAPFSLDFQFNSGNTLNNNTAFISNFNFSGGSAFGPATLIGGASGSLLSTVTLADTGAFNEFFQSFNVGSILSFDVSLSRNFDAGLTPDIFSFGVLDNSLFNIPTTGFADQLLSVNLPASLATFQTFTGTGSYTGITVSIVPVPEPATYGVVGCAVLLVAVLISRSRRFPRSPVGRDRFV